MMSNKMSNKFKKDIKYADMAELVDAQDLKSCGPISRAGSIPAICTNAYKLLDFIHGATYN